MITIFEDFKRPSDTGTYFHISDLRKLFGHSKEDTYDFKRFMEYLNKLIVGRTISFYDSTKTPNIKKVITKIQSDDRDGVWVNFDYNGAPMGAKIPDFRKIVIHDPTPEIIQLLKDIKSQTTGKKFDL